jgi:hypothetical protein
MEILRLEHSDFTLSVECKDFQSAFRNARTKHTDLFSATVYEAEGADIQLVDPETERLTPYVAALGHPVFFENKDYFFGIQFHAPRELQRATIYSRLRDVENKFYLRQNIGFMSGTINFGNELGKSDLILRYQVGESSRQFIFTFEVFPTKLDYRQDFARLVADIETEYPNLVLDFLKKTYQGYRSGGSQNTNLIWWQIFGGLYQEFVRASRFILQRPHSRIVQEHRRVSADRLTSWTPNLEETYGEFKHLPDFRYLSSYKTLSNDTAENRFFKHALLQTTHKYKKLQEYIEGKFRHQISAAFREEMLCCRKELDTLCRSPFLRTISEFKTIKQESLVLQRASGYSTIYRSWVMLNRGLMLLDDIQKIDLKNIADLYQIWCFLEVKKTLQRLLGKGGPDDVKIARVKLSKLVLQVEKDAQSRVVFDRGNGERVELYHDFSYTTDEEQDVRSYTITQRPDIVLNIIKNDLRDNYCLTYLYDAKYRLQSDDDPLAPDFPPDDAINQMHRYRDAIYYLNKTNNKPEKEVIGAYILFPGSGSLHDIKMSEYYQSIQTVNVGAFPLRPADDPNRVLFEDHLARILGIDTESALYGVAPQKLNSYETFNPEVLIGYVKDAVHETCLEVDEAPVYYTGKNRKIAKFAISSLKYFAPYFPTYGVSEFYEILGCETLPRNEIFPAGHPLNVSDRSMRLVFHLGRRTVLCPKKDGYKLVGGPPRPYKYSRLRLLRQPREGKIEVI